MLIFSTLAFRDWRKFGSKSRRLKEYGFIIAVTALTITYAAIHDLVTSSISSEYFTAGKGLAADHLHLRAMWLGALAAIGPGALVGVAFIFANNPMKDRIQLSYRRLASYLRFPIFGALSGALLFGILGYFDVRNVSPDLVGSINEPQWFITVWGIHWGTYSGGFLGLSLAVVLIMRARYIRAAQ